MKAIQLLIDEHLLIEQVLECLERMVEHCMVEHTLEMTAARDAIAFFRGFTERCHCSKEESELLPAMSRAIVASSRRRLDCSLLQRREEGLMHVDRMESLIEPAANSNTMAMEEFVKHARAYIALLLEYIAKEEDCLFPMVDQILPEAEKVRLVATLDTPCCNGDPQGKCEDYVDLANRLADHFGVPRRPIETKPNRH